MSAPRQMIQLKTFFLNATHGAKLLELNLQPQQKGSCQQLDEKKGDTLTLIIEAKASLPPYSTRCKAPHKISYFHQKISQHYERDVM